MPNIYKFEPFTYKSLDALKKKYGELDLYLPTSSNLSVLKQSINIQNLTIANRLSIQPMEGFDAYEDGSPGDLTARRYTRYANGGAGLIWFEATSIADSCRSNLHQLMLTKKNLNKFKRLVDQIKKICNKTLRSLGFKDKCILILQLNHSGRYSKIGLEKFPIRAYNNQDLDAAINVGESNGILISDDEIKNVEQLWIEKALLARKAGFDGVDIKACHGYLISELLTSRIREDSIYGGLYLENRSKLFLNIIKSLCKEFKKDGDFIITTRFGVYDGIPYPNGFGTIEDKTQTFPASSDLTEPLKIIKELYKQGMRLINISAGNPHYKAHITRPFDTPIKGAKIPDEHPLYSVFRLIDLTSAIKSNLPGDMVVIGSGYSYLRQYAANVIAALVEGKTVDICGFGRMALANPNFPKQLFQQGFIEKNLTCITCSKCSTLMRQGKSTGCVIRDPQYKNLI